MLPRRTLALAELSPVRLIVCVATKHGCSAQFVPSSSLFRHQACLVSSLLVMARTTRAVLPVDVTSSWDCALARANHMSVVWCQPQAISLC